MVNLRQSGIYPMGLIFTSILVLAIPGIIYNNMSNSGLAGPFTLVCAGPFSAGQNIDPTCQNSAATGCQLDPSSCTLNANNISFLNGKSPFTTLIKGNVWGFFTGLTNAQSGTQGGRGPFDALGGQFYNLNCRVTKGASGHQTDALIGTGGDCTQTGTDNKNLTEMNTNVWLNWNLNQSFIQTNLQLFNLGNASFPMTCSWINQINYTALTNGPGWTYFGCDISKGSHVITHQIWSLLIAMPVSVGGIVTGHYNLFAYLSDVDFDGALPATSPFWSLKYENFEQTFKGITISGGALTTTQFVPGVNGPVLSFIVGLALIIGGLGINFVIGANVFGTGGSLGMGINRQGTKLMQILGLGLILWSFFYSQFATWFTTGLLPNGLDGTLGVISVTLSGLFFGGIVWQATQD